MRQTKNAKKTQKVSKFERKEANMDLARKQDNCLALGAFIAIWIIGLHLHWYNFYTNEKALEIALLLAFWRLPFLGVLAINSKERKYWLNAIRKYFLPDCYLEPEYKKSATK